LLVFNMIHRGLRAGHKKSGKQPKPCARTQWRPDQGAAGPTR
jgi:hypothetical protein